MEYQALISKNTRMGEKPYRITLFELGKPIEHADMDEPTFDSAKARLLKLLNVPSANITITESQLNTPDRRRGGVANIKVYTDSAAVDMMHKLDTKNEYFAVCFALYVNVATGRVARVRGQRNDARVLVTFFNDGLAFAYEATCAIAKSDKKCREWVGGKSLAAIESEAAAGGFA